VAPSHLSFKKGEEIVLYGRPSAEWWNGGLGVKRGDFPASKVVIVEKKEKRKWGKARAESAKVAVESGPATPEQEDVVPESLATHEVTFKIVKATDLAAKGANGLSDPMVKCSIISINGELEGSKRQTRKVKGNLSPEWNETFSVEILDPLWEVLRLEVVDGGENDKFMGQTEVACGELLGQCEADAWDIPLEPPLDPRALDTVVSGSITIAVTKVVNLQSSKGTSGGVPKMGSLAGDTTSP
jgi:Ca2+-dependent lipid-binding protein